MITPLMPLILTQNLAGKGFFELHPVALTAALSGDPPGPAGPPVEHLERPPRPSGAPSCRTWVVERQEVDIVYYSYYSLLL